MLFAVVVVAVVALWAWDQMAVGSKTQTSCEIVIVPDTTSNCSTVAAQELTLETCGFMGQLPDVNIF